MGRFLQFDYFDVPPDDAELCAFYDAFVKAGIGLKRFETKEELLPRPPAPPRPDPPPLVREAYLRTLTRDKLLTVAKYLGVDVIPSDPNEDIIERIVRRW